MCIIYGTVISQDSSMADTQIAMNQILQELQGVPTGLQGKGVLMI